MEIVSSVLLGFVQGITEFLPISSTGHTILARSLFGIADEHALAFDAVMHLATACAVVIYFRKDLWFLLQIVLRYIGRLPVEPRDLTLVVALMVGTVPAAALGLFLEGAMDVFFRSPILVAGVLIAGSVLFAIAEYAYVRTPRTRTITVRTGVLVGLFQTLALIPGMSRAGVTIAGGMLVGLSRADATRFSFLLAIPILLGAGTKKLIEMFGDTVDVSWSAVAIGSIVAFIVGILTIHFLLAFLRRYTLWPFIWYRILLAGIVLVAAFSG